MLGSPAAVQQAVVAQQLAGWLPESAAVSHFCQAQFQLAIAVAIELS